MHWHRLRPDRLGPFDYLFALAIPLLNSAWFVWRHWHGDAQLPEGFVGPVHGVGMVSLVSVIVAFRITASVLHLPYYALYIVAFLIPHIFTMIYVTLTAFEPNCVSGAAHPFDYAYFSYVTLTTVGYGDLQPGGVCRSVAVIQAVIGLLSIGVVPSLVIAKLYDARS